jgi:hypothetical protein
LPGSRYVRDLIFNADEVRSVASEETALPALELMLWGKQFKDYRAEGHQACVNVRANEDLMVEVSPEEVAKVLNRSFVAVNYEVEVLNFL